MHREGRSDVVWFHDEAVLIRDADGNPRFWQGVMFDITEQKEVEQRLRAAEERYRALVEHIPAVVYAEAIVADPRRALRQPPGRERRSATRLEEWRRTEDFWKDTPAPRRPRADARGQRAGESATASRSAPSTGSSPPTAPTAGSTTRPCGSSTTTESRCSGRGSSWTSPSRRRPRRDCGRRRRASAPWWSTFPPVVYTESPDADPAKFYISPQIETLFGYTPEEWTWTPNFWADHIHPDDHEAAMARDAEADRTRESYSGEFRFRTADGRWLWIHDEAHRSSASPTARGSGRGSCWTSRPARRPRISCERPS